MSCKNLPSPVPIFVGLLGADDWTAAGNSSVYSSTTDKSCAVDEEPA